MRDAPADEAFWNERYRGSTAVWSGEPNARLVEEVAGLAPGAALDVGCGEGADAIWLAERGWHVTAVDIATTALERARAVAVPAAVAARIDWRRGDLIAHAPEPAAYDLVSAHFMQIAPEPRASLLRGLSAAVRSGGTLLIVGHHPSDLATGVRRPRGPGVLYSAEEVAALLALDDWEITVCASRPRDATAADGNAVIVHDAVLRARRRD